MNEAQKEFPDLKIRYSYNSSDYFDIYDSYDLVIGPRIHGIGIAASKGIPGVAIKHDMRGDTAKGFGACIINASMMSVDEGIALIENCVNNIHNFSLACANIKENARQEYQKILKSKIEG